MYSKAQTSLKEIAGKWQEESRYKKKDKPLDFKDTLRMEIRADGFMMIRHPRGATLTGEAELSGRKLKLENVKYSIVEVSQDKLVLNDNEGDHIFKKMPEFTSAPVTKMIPGVEEGKKDITNAVLKGKWSCYKKTDPEFSRVKFYLRNIDFKEEKGQGAYDGTVSFNNNDSVYTADAIMLVKDSGFNISYNTENFKADVVKSDGEELILRSGNVHYFMKQFGKE
jgi:hypothetical protein